MRTDPPESTLRIGVIGTGGISRAHAPGWRAVGAELHCFSLAGAQEFAEQFDATVHDSLESLLAAVEAVDICTPTDQHADLIHRALDAGLHVISEKPLTLTPEAAREVLAHAERTGLRVLPAHVVRYFPQYEAAHRAIRDGAIGTPAVLRFERTGSFPRQAWFGDESRSGGIVMDQMIHDIDQAIWIAGPVASVYAQQSTAPGDDTVRTGHVVLTHTGGAISHCRGFWGPAGTAFRYTFDLAGDGGRLRYDSHGDSGIVFDAVAAARQESGDGFLPRVTTMDDPYASEIREFAAAIRDGAPTRVIAADGAYAVAISHAAIESLHTGRSIAC